ncbi:MAG: carboxymuconolactone decarboxylase family protein [Nitrospinota bacterium]|jgi:4-carboxymuconolactone decarboxylase|nr:carboxymuconolactone decarboxylase family protein [Nitrospinota bacterium]MDP7370730.1 carboxymuconolactone decarboxylase family protein [Nitrospinota bacterium]MDP7661837.1 carboxymuconolactone decarboxylase family protein [Nitrospinota bacterium]HJP13391.1 carboxymuconolactone decarboxylase family protein [Nitrospinota bacterium]
MTDDEKFYPPAIKRGDAQYGEGYSEAFFERLNNLDPGFSMIFQRSVHGGLYDRDVIDHKTRELCAIAALCVTGMFNQLRAHFSAAASYGATDREILEVIVQMFTYVGAPAVLESIKVYEEWIAQGRTMSGFGSEE